MRPNDINGGVPSSSKAVSRSSNHGARIRVTLSWRYVRLAVRMVISESNLRLTESCFAASSSYEVIRRSRLYDADHRVTTLRGQPTACRNNKMQKGSYWGQVALEVLAHEQGWWRRAASALETLEVSHIVFPDDLSAPRLSYCHSSGRGRRNKSSTISISTVDRQCQRPSQRTKYIRSNAVLFDERAFRQRCPSRR